MRRLLIGFLLLIGIGVSPALAQSPCQYIAYGVVLTPGQWQSCFESKQDINTFGGVTNFTPGNGLRANQASGAVVAATTDTQRSITGTYTIGQSGNDDCGIHLVASGGTFYPINASGSYTCPNGGNYTVKITNADPIPTGSNSTGAKFINIVNCIPSESGTYLWPQQTMEITQINGSWVPTECPPYWKAPPTLTINVAPGTGSDTWGVSDGLSTGTRSFNSISVAMYVVGDTMAGGFFSGTNFVFTLCASCTDSATIHWPPHGGPVNSNGRAGITINCNGGTFSGQIDLFFGGAIVEGDDCNFTNTIAPSEGAEFVIGAGNTFTPVSGGYNFDLTQGGKVFGGNTSFNIAAGSGDGFINIFSGGGSVIGLVVNQTGNLTFSDAVIRVQASGFVGLTSWTTNANSTTGTAFKLVECGVIEGSTSIPGSTGTESCIQNN